MHRPFLLTGAVLAVLGLGLDARLLLLAGVASTLWAGAILMARQHLRRIRKH